MREPYPFILRFYLTLTTVLGLAFVFLSNTAFAEDAVKPAVPTQGQAPKRTFRTFLPKPGDAIDEPASQLVQTLLDRQDKGDYESYMVQVLFRGKISPDHNVHEYDDRIVIDFFDTGKPSMRLAKIRGGAVEASSVEELFYRDAAPKSTSAEKSGPRTPASQAGPQARIKRMVRLTLFIHKKVGDLKFRDTLDRTLIHFRLPKPS